MAHYQQKKKPIIFVTDDNKEDWWLKENGETKRPRPELIKEFFDETGTRILIYNPEQFLNIARERNLISIIKDDTLNEIKDVRRIDELDMYMRQQLEEQVDFEYYLNKKVNSNFDQMHLFGDKVKPDDFLHYVNTFSHKKNQNPIYNDQIKILSHYLQRLIQEKNNKQNGEDPEESDNLVPA